MSERWYVSDPAGYEVGSFETRKDAQCERDALQDEYEETDTYWNDGGSYVVMLEDEDGNSESVG